MFYDYIVFMATVEKVANEIGEVKEHIVKGDFFTGDIQPIDESTKEKTWGKDIKATINLYTDIDFNVNEYLFYNTQLYQIEKKIDWGSYKIYALRSVKNGL